MPGPGPRRRRALWLLGALTLGLLAVLAVLDGRMQDTGGPGIVGFELAGTRERAAEILADWGEKGRDAARLSLWVDYPYLLAYGAFGALAVAATRDTARSRGWERLSRHGAWIVALPVAGAACDAVENAGLLLALDGRGGDAAPAVALAFALMKFACTLTVAAYLLAGLVARVRGRRS